MKIRITLLLFFQFLALNGYSQETPAFLKYTDHPWVDSVLKSLTQRERIGQLIWMACFADRDLSWDADFSNRVRDNGIGGIIFFQGKSEKQAEMINHFRRITRVPPIIATDAEWGLGMRLSDVGSFPFQMTLGAITDEKLIYGMGVRLAQQMKKAGVNINLAPVADVNNNPKNPVISFRSFGESPDAVALKSKLYMQGLQDNGIIAVAKHFPGHGDTEVDSHVDLPVIPYNRSRLDSVEFKPFRALIDAGIQGVMPGHLWISDIDKTGNNPATLSEPVISGLLKKEMNFRGLILSDAMNMGGLTKYAAPGEAEVLALAAGIDVLEYVTDPEKAIAEIEKAIKEKKLNAADIDEKCRKVLAAKFWAGLSKPETVNTVNLPENLYGPEEKALNYSLYESAITLLNNNANIVPLRKLDTLKVATLTIGNDEITRFEERLGSYTRCTNFAVKSYSEEDIEKAELLLKSIGEQSTLVAAFFGSPYTLGRLGKVQESDGLLLCYQDNEVSNDVAAQIIFGGSGATGRLPVSISEKYAMGYGISTGGNLRLKYGVPENSGLSSAALTAKVDSIAFSGIERGAYPGCEIMIASKGRVIFHSTYGYQTYENRIAVGEHDLFDLASVTKISSSMAGLLLLDSKNLFTPDKTLAEYLPYYRRSDKGNIVVREMLAHQARLTAWIPFWRETVLKNGEFRKGIFSKCESQKYPLKVADELYINRNYRAKIFREIKESPLRNEKKYLYSDLTFIIMPDIIEKLSGRKFGDFLTEEVYRKIGAWDICFNPWKSYPPVRIVPTEYDSLFRKQLLHGTVHDEGAAMLGGISGHAGLFATAGDLMKLMELYRRMGDYGGEQIFDPDVMKEYTSYQFPENSNRRGVGFDKPLVNNKDVKPSESYPCQGASPSSFGHSGYTGTFVWIDPEKEITYIFFCNRVYPTRNNNLLSDLNIRTNILQAIYDSSLK
jgi:beta-glucosidase-like glycosyl hydrolase/CubicO group peptidase (beta-lactamase class C family)